MSKFSLRLHYGPDRNPVDEPLEALDEIEARQLAQMRLLLTHEFSEIELTRNGRRIEAFHRDGPR